MRLCFVSNNTLLHKALFPPTPLLLYVFITVILVGDVLIQTTREKNPATTTTTTAPCASNRQSLRETFRCTQFGFSFLSQKPSTGGSVVPIFSTQNNKSFIAASVALSNIKTS